MAGLNDKFVLEIKKDVAKTIEEIFLYKKRVAIDLFSRVINDSPAETGRFRANWYVTQTQPSNRYNPNGRDNVAGTGPGINKDANGVAKDRMVNRVEAMKKPSGHIYLANNSPYGDVLEYGLYPKGNDDGKTTVKGFSKKAPEGMVDKNVIIVKAGLK